MIIVSELKKKDLDISKLEPLLAILKKHPQQYETTKSIRAKDINRKLDKLESLFK